MKRQTMLLIAGLVFMGVLTIRDLIDTWEIVKALFVVIDVLLIIYLLYGLHSTCLASKAIKEVKAHLLSITPNATIINNAFLTLDNKEICDTLAQALVNQKPQSLDEARAALFAAKAKHEEARAVYALAKADELKQNATGGH